MENKALVVTHPHPEYDHGVIPHLEEYIDSFEGDIIALTEFDGEKPKEMYGEENQYNAIIEDAIGGTIPEELADTLTSIYDDLELAGGYARECLRNTYQDLRESSNSINIKLNPDLTYAQARDTFTVEDVIQFGNETEIEKFLQPYRDGGCSLA